MSIVGLNRYQLRCIKSNKKNDKKKRVTFVSENITLFREMRQEVMLVLILMPVIIFVIYVALTLYCGFVKGRWISPGPRRGRDRRHREGWGEGGGGGGGGGDGGR